MDASLPLSDGALRAAEWGRDPTWCAGLVTEAAIRDIGDSISI
jgi:hypothetical protein